MKRIKEQVSLQAMNSSFSVDEDEIIIIPEANDEDSEDIKMAFETLKPEFVLQEIFAAPGKELR